MATEYKITITADDHGVRAAMAKLDAELAKSGGSVKALNDKHDDLGKSAKRAGMSLAALGRTAGGDAAAQLGRFGQAAISVIDSLMYFGPQGAVIAAIGVGLGLAGSYFSDLAQTAKKHAADMQQAYFDAVRGSAAALESLYAIGASAEGVAIRKLEKEIEIRKKNVAAAEKTGRVVARGMPGYSVENDPALSRERALIAELELGLQAKKDTAFWTKYIEDSEKRLTDLIEQQNKLAAAGAKGREDLAKKEKKAAADSAPLSDDDPKMIAVRADGARDLALLKMKLAQELEEMQGIFRKGQERFDEARLDKEKRLSDVKIELAEKLADIDRRLADEKYERDLANAQRVSGALADGMVGALSQSAAYYGEMLGNMLAGNADVANKMGRDQDLMLAKMAQGIISNLSSQAIGEGSILVARGTAEAFLGNPGGLAAAGIGAALLAGGLAGTFGSAAIGGAVSAEEGRRRDQAGGGTSAGGAYRTEAPTVAGAGSSGGSETTIINYYFGGPVFGNPDDAARTVSRLNDRGQLLRGAHRG